VITLREAEPPMPTTDTATDTQPTMCLLHGDFHVTDRACWEATTTWYLDRIPHTDRQELDDAYQAAVERQMLDQLMEALR
jgi:hypothetical protein